MKGLHGYEMHLGIELTVFDNWISDYSKTVYDHMKSTMY